MHLRVGRRERVGQGAGPVRARVVHDQDVRHRDTGPDPADDVLDVEPLLVGRDDDQHALAPHDLGRQAHDVGRGHLAGHAAAPPAPPGRVDRRHGRRGQPRSGQQPLRPAAQPGGQRLPVAQRHLGHQRAGDLLRSLLGHRPVRPDDRADAAGRGHQHVPPGLDGAQPGHRHLLVRAARCRCRWRCWSARRGPGRRRGPRRGPARRRPPRSRSRRPPGPARPSGCRAGARRRSPAGSGPAARSGRSARPGTGCTRRTAPGAASRSGRPGRSAGPRRCRCCSRGRGRGRPAPRPTSTGTPTSFTASSIRACAEGSWNGSMSEAFSGHTTRSGRSTRPARTSAASRWVASTWLRSTCSRSPNGSIPTPGTLPCTSATVTGRPSPAPTGSRRPATGTATASRTSGTARRHDPSASTAAAARAPHRAVAKVTSGAPPTAAYGVNGEAVSAKASRPHGNPPNGTESRASSSATQRQATHSGQPGSRSTDGVRAPAQRQERGLEQRHQEPGIRPDDGQPGQQRHEGGQAVHQADRRSPPGGQAAAEQDQQRDAHRRQRPEVVGRERQGDQRPADGGTGQPRTESSRPPPRRRGRSAGGCRRGLTGRGGRHDGLLPGTSRTDRHAIRAGLRRYNVSARRAVPTGVLPRKTGQGPNRPSDRPRPAGCRIEGRCLLGGRALPVSHP